MCDEQPNNGDGEKFQHKKLQDVSGWKAVLRMADSCKDANSYLGGGWNCW
jgi:hypothetical protein